MAFPGSNKRFSIDYLLQRADPIKTRCLLSNVCFQTSGFMIKQELSTVTTDRSDKFTEEDPGHPASSHRRLSVKRESSGLLCSSSSDTTEPASKRTCTDEDVVDGDNEHDKTKGVETSNLNINHVGVTNAVNFGETFPLGHTTRRQTFIHGGYGTAEFMSPISGKGSNNFWHSMGDITEEFEDYQEDTPDTDSQEVETSQDGVSVFLQNSNLWSKFHKRGTEMIINRTGRRMFPRISFRLTGLNPAASYSIVLMFQRSDGCRYKFINGKWHSTQTTELHEMSQVYTHPESPKTGEFWMKTIVNFSKLKITNNVDADDEQVFLQSMYKYIPCITIIENSEDVQADDSQASSTTSEIELPSSKRRSYEFSFPLTTFVAVTAYQNEKITYLKIKNNPFAKAFREPDKSGSYRSLSGNFGLFRQPPTETYPLCSSLQNVRSFVNIPPASSSVYRFHQMFNSARSLTHLTETNDVFNCGRLHHNSSMDSNRYRSLSSSRSLHHLGPSTSSVSIFSEDDSAYGSMNSVATKHIL